MSKLIKDYYVGLETIYHTPHVCGNCFAHIADDWNFCPCCGKKTRLTSEDYEESQRLLKRLQDRMNGGNRHE